MPTADQKRIAHDRARPRLMELWWALQPLKSVVRFMQTGAHPDDETSGMLAALAFRDGINISYACSTRGEGGQNDIGTEAGLDLGALRTREMERACDILGMRMYWHSTHQDDTITDFGFSKSGKETLGRWGYDRIILRFVEIIRAERPDIICPTFLDVPGQHGHHRAMTEAAHVVMDVAADPNLLTNLPPWQVKKLYLPAWSGAGQAYDDDLPPPDATLRIKGTDSESMTGWAWNRIGQQSRAYHRTQGMGRWVPAGDGQDWPLHLADTRVAGPDDELWSGLPKTLGDLAILTGAEQISENLVVAASEIEEAVAVFPDFDRVAASAARSLSALQQARNKCPVEVADDILHRVDAKIAQMGKVLQLALGVEAIAVADRTFIAVGSSFTAQSQVYSGCATSVSVDWLLPEAWSIEGDKVHISEAAKAHDPYRAFYDPIAPAAPAMRLEIAAHGATAEVPIAFEVEPVILPGSRAVIEPTAIIVNRNSTKRSFELRVTGVDPINAGLSLELPTGWSAHQQETGFTVVLPDDVSSGEYSIGLMVDGFPAQTVRQIEHDHIAPTARTQGAIVDVGVFDAAVPNTKVAYIGAGNDRAGYWLAEMGADVTNISNEMLANPAALEAFDAVVLGIFAMRFRPGLSDAMPSIHKWVESGGTLITLYHRPWDNWDPSSTPPRPLEIGQPSLRWRVTDEAAKVTQLEKHDILESPNKIGESDWSGWVKERGLYFAKSWDAAYRPLLSMSDPDEDPLHGSLLVADIGKGRHIHTSLILHHQMEHLVPGAFRLMANFISRRG